MTNVPTYQGAGQPVVPNGTGLLARIGTFLGQGSAPAYLGDGQPSLTTSGLFGSGAPAYQQAPIVMQPKRCPRPDCEMPCTTEAQAAIPCPADCDLFANGPIAIIVPRQG